MVTPVIEPADFDRAPSAHLFGAKYIEDVLEEDAPQSESEFPQVKLVPSSVRGRAISSSIDGPKW